MNISALFLELLILFVFKTCCDYIFHKFIACYVKNHLILFYLLNQSLISVSDP